MIAAAIGVALAVVVAVGVVAVAGRVRKPGPTADLAGRRISADPLRPSPDPTRLRQAYRPLPVTYTYAGRRHTLDDLLTRTGAQGFVVLDSGNGGAGEHGGDGADIVYERYRDAGPGTLFQSWSMAKSFTSAAVGIALGDGRVTSIDDPVTKYLPELRRSGYDGVSIRDLLRMSSGIAWNEAADIPLVHVAASRGMPIPALAARQTRGYPPGSRFDYTSMNSAVLAWLVERATGVPYHRYVEQRIWQPAGMESAAYIGDDRHGHALGYCCYYATDRDYARFGLLYLRGGAAHGQQVVPRSWVARSTRPSADFNARYGLHWWLGGDGKGDFMAAGFGGQYIYVSPRTNVVIVTSTADRGPAARRMQPETLTAFRAVAAEVARTR